MLKIIQTIASTRLDHGGTSRSVPALCNSLAELGCENHLITALPWDNSIASNFPLPTTKVFRAMESPLLRQMGVGSQFVSFLKQLTSGSESNSIVHDHAIWLATNHVTAVFCRRNKIARVVSPRGMIGKWAMQNGGLKKKIAWLLYQQRDLRTASAFHATSHQEAREIRDLGFTQPIAIVPNGIEFPNILPAQKKDGKRKALFLSRIHPKKGLIELLRAWKIAKIDPTWELLIAGPDEQGYRAYVEKEAARLKLTGEVKFLGPIVDSDKWQLYVDSDFFILPSHNENFGIVIAEAMIAGLPVITTRGTPWQSIEEFGCGWWIHLNEEALSQSLRMATSLSPPQLNEMGTRAKNFVGRTYSWVKSAENLLTFYTWLNSKGKDATFPTAELLNFCDFQGSNGS